MRAKYYVGDTSFIKVVEAFWPAPIWIARLVPRIVEVF